MAFESFDDLARVGLKRTAMKAARVIVESEFSDRPHLRPCSGSPTTWSSEPAGSQARIGSNCWSIALTWRSVHARCRLVAVSAFMEACKADVDMRARVEGRLPQVLATFAVQA